MNPMNCSVCKEGNFLPSSEVLLVATFAYKTAAQEALRAMQKAHIVLVGYEIFSQEDTATLIMLVHGIKDIVQLQALYIESMCQERKSLTFDSFASKKQQEKFLLQLP